MDWSLDVLEELTQAEVVALIYGNLNKDHANFALSLKKNNIFSVSQVASQLKAVQKAQYKLPEWVEAECIFPPISLEQCSSIATSMHRNMRGKRCLDLTCGLGVDAWAFSKSFEEVITVEQDAALVATAKYNFSRLGANNIQVVHSSAEAFLEQYQGEKFDWVFVDPHRRDEGGKRVFLPEDCSPNILIINELMKRVGERVRVKYSPLYDVDAAQKQFPDAQISVISVENECKETLLTFSEEIPTGIDIQIIKGVQCLDFTVYKNEQIVSELLISPLYVYEPDVAFYKSRCIESLFLQYFPELVGELVHNESFLLSEKINSSVFPGRRFRIASSFFWKPKEIMNYLKEEKITHLNVLQRHFPFSAQQIRETLKVKEGGNLFLICSEDKEKRKRVWLAERF